jgi:trehalose/maltose hydrolase-like predicted phosphorylase
MKASDPWTPISPPPATGPLAGDLPAYVSNGLIGLRILDLPLAPGMAIVSGFAGDHPERLVEAAAPAPYPLAGDIALDGLWASEVAGAASPTDQAYDFSTGELTTRFRVELPGGGATVEVVTFASRTHPTLVCQSVCIDLDNACDLTFRARVETRGVRGRMVERRLDTPGEEAAVCDGTILWRSDGGLGACGIALLTQGPEAAARTQDPWDTTGPLSTTYGFHAGKGRHRFTQIVSLVPDALHSQPQRQAVRMVAAAREPGFDALRSRNREAWRDLWRGRIRLDGAGDRWQGIADAAFFYLNSSVHASSPASTSIFGLATWRDYHYYFGHVMWDVDAFATPVLTLLQPGAARALLDFRSKGLEAARKTAQMLGRQGVKFPWEAGPRHGEETAPGAGDAALREDHVNLHIARAFALFADATGDDRFLREQAWPVLSGVADWIVDRVEADGDRFVFRDIGGPAEREETADNDALTTLAARIVLDRARAAAAQRGIGAPGAWRDVASGLRPTLRADGVIADHDGYRKTEEKGATPGALMGLFPYWADLDEDTRQRTLRFYLDQWRDYVGSPMLAALYGVWAAWTGDRDLSLQLQEEGFAAYQSGRFLQTLEYRLDKIDGVAAGPFFANIGGFLTGLLLGLPALRISDGDPDEWSMRTVVLPRGWTAIRCDRLWIRGAAWRLSAPQGRKATLEPA